MKAWLRQWLLVLKSWFVAWLKLVLWPWRWWIAGRRRTDNAPEAVPTAAPAAPTKPRRGVARAKLVPAAKTRTKPKTRQRRPPVFATGMYHHATGQRDYKLYGAPVAGADPVPLVVMLHGCKQSPDDFALGTRMNQHAEARGCMVLYPAQSRLANGYGCWNWFNPHNQAREGGETALLAGMVRHVMASHPVDPERVVVMGLSAGAAMAVNLACAYPELVRGVGVHSGLPFGAAQGAMAAMKAMKQGAPFAGHWPARSVAVPVVIFHGDRDEVVHPVNAMQLVAQLTGTVWAGGAGVDAEAAMPVPAQAETVPAGAVRGYTRHVYRGADGQTVHEYWLVHGAGHAWSGGDVAGSYTEGDGPDATREMLRFLLGPMN